MIFIAILIIFLQEISITQIGQILGYIISVIIGGVGYKYIKLWLSNNSENKDRQQQANENLLDNMEGRIKKLTGRIDDLETKREEAFKREVKLIKTLAKAEERVEFLKEKVKILEKNQELLKETIDKYYSEYGPLDEIIEKE